MKKTAPTDEKKRLADEKTIHLHTKQKHKDETKNKHADDEKRHTYI